MPQNFFPLDGFIPIYTGTIFDKLSLNVASCQTTDSTESVCSSIELDFKDLKTT